MKAKFLNVVLLTTMLALWTRAGVAADVNLPPLDTPYDQCTWLATHNSYANPDEGFLSARSNQPHSITDQLNYGVRVLNPDIWLIRQKPNLLGCWIWEVYTGSDTSPGFRFSTNDPLQVVVAHGLDEPTADEFHNPCDPWKSLSAVLNEIGTWAAQHPNEVVTIEFETKIDSDYEVRINSVINGSSIANRRFFPNAPDPQTNSMPAPQGRSGGWRVDRYGYPTLRQLVQAGKNVVLFPTYLPRSAPNNSWKLEVQTVYGHECLPPYNIGMDWVLPRAESSALNDFTRPLFSVVHVPDLPGISPYDGIAGINNIALLLSKWQDIETLYRRLPNIIWMDYYERGYTGSTDPADPPAPTLFVNYLNALWNIQPLITANAQLSPPPSSFGWNNTDVNVFLSGTGDAIQAITSQTFGGTNNAISAKTSYELKTEGITTVSFSAVGSLGRRSPTRLVDVRIDKTPPTITGMLDRPPDQAGWYASDVTAHFECADTLSGVASCPMDIVLNQDGANQSVTGTTVDRANNQSSTTITNINIDKTGPVIHSSANSPILWPPNNKLVPVVISGTMTDAGSGVDPATATFSVTDDYRKIEPKGRIVMGTQGNFSLTLHLEARRLGNDIDGRHYVVRVNSSDRVGHASESFITVTVPHDQRKN